MILIQNAPAENWSQAFMLGNGDVGFGIYADQKAERISLLERKFLKRRDKKISRGRAVIGHLRIETEQDEVQDYQRRLDLDQGTVSAAWEWKEKSTNMISFVPKSYKILVYELTRPVNDMNLKISYEPQNPEDYVNYNMGGVFFTSVSGTNLICGKAALYTNGFPKADELGLYIKNASRVALYIMVDMTEFNEPDEEQRVMLDLQMRMNKQLVQMESHPLADFEKGPKAGMASLRKMKKRLEKSLPEKWKNGSLE